MEASGLAFAVAQTVLAALQCSDLRELFSRFRCESELEQLKKTIQTIQSVLRDADNKGELSEQELDFVGKLKYALLDADDLVDEFATVAAQEKQSQINKGKGIRRFSKKVNRLFSRFNKWSVAYDMSRDVKHIRQTLNGIAKDVGQFCFKVDNQPIRQRRETTCSYVYQTDIIGREEDTKRVIDMLLGPNVEGHIPVLTIVGIGGLGKTTLAQLIFNDPRIATAFPTLRLWACVNDEGQRNLNVDSVLGSILKSATDEQNINGYDTEQLQKKLREKLDGKKYFIVFDDVWTEKHTEWLKLVKFFKGGQSGSRILVTTRSKATATAVGSDSKLTYELEGLTDDNSWRLFEVTAGEIQANCSDLVLISRAIVKKCANVPLAIKVIGSLLFGQDKQKWRSFENYGLFEIAKGDNDIMHILKFSYHHLSPSLKSCFTYCALFPKDFVIERDMLIRLWMAQVYIEPLDVGQSIEDAAAEYFSILLRRCFFQDVKKDEFGEIVSCKIHDLMHDVAQEVARKEICTSVANDTTMNSLGETIRHLHIDSSICTSICTKSFFTKAKTRTYLSRGNYKLRYNLGRPLDFIVDAMLANLMCLRVLSLNWFGIHSLPDAIGGMLHLRYLDLSDNSHLQVLPESITKLHNLQTLLLRHCSLLRVLPEDLSKLVNLRVVDITSCFGLTCMPQGMEKLTSLFMLPMFVMAGRVSSSKQGVGEIEDLGPLKNLKGSLSVKISKNYRINKEKCGEGVGYLRNKEHLNDISIQWPHDLDGSCEERVQEQEALLEYLQPHCNLRVLELHNYHGERIPRWAGDDKLATAIRNLVKISLWNCEGLKELPWLCKLHNLKSIILFELSNLEYMENNNNISSSSSSPMYGKASTEVEQPLFFPSLEELELIDLHKLKGWWRGSVDSSSNSNQPVGVFPWFPRLSKLMTMECPNLTSIPGCPMLEDLLLGCVNERLRIEIGKTDEKLWEGSSNSDRNSTWGSSSSITSYRLHSGESSSSSLRDYVSHRNDPKLKKLQVRDVECLKSLAIHDLCCLTLIRIQQDSEMESMLGGVFEEVLCSCSSSLRFLAIHCCPKLKSVGGLEHLTALESLELKYLKELRFAEEEEGEEDGSGIGISTPWRSFGDTLRTLKLVKLPKMVKLPRGIRHLTSLQSLRIQGCPLEGLPEWIGSPGCFSSLQSLEIWGAKMESLPDAMRNLTSLRKLDIGACHPILEQRCQSPDGEDWPKIQHILHTTITTK